MFSTAKVKPCYTKDKCGKLNQKITFKVNQDDERLLGADEYFKLRDGESVFEEFPRLWKNHLLVEQLLMKGKLLLRNLNQI